MNQKPFLGLLAVPLTVTGAELAARPHRLFHDAAVIDGDWQGGKLTISGLASGDMVSLATDASVQLQGSSIVIGYSPLARFETTSDGSAVVIRFAPFASTKHVEAIIERLTLQAESGRPLVARDLRFTLADETGSTWHSSGATYGQTADPWHQMPSLSERPWEHDMAGDYGALDAPAAFDRNGDGKADALVYGTLQGTIRYFERGSDGLMLERTGRDNPFGHIALSVGDETISLNVRAIPTFCDFDRDGDLDLFLGNDLGGAADFAGFSTYENRNGTFVPLTGSADPFSNLAKHHGPPTILKKGDGTFLLAATSTSGQTTAFENPFTNLFIPRPDLLNVRLGEHVRLTAVDLNGDGRDDLVAGSAEGTVRAFLQDASGRLVEATGTANPFAGVDIGQGSAPAFFDVNGDGRLDLVTGSASGAPQVFTQAPGVRVAIESPELPRMAGVPATRAVVGGSGAQRLAPEAYFSDDNFKSGTITVEGLLAGDKAGLLSGGGIGQIGNILSLNGVLLGRIEGGSGGTLTIKIGGAASTVQTILRNLTFEARADGSATRTLSVVVTDQDGHRSDAPRAAVFDNDPDPMIPGFHKGIAAYEGDLDDYHYYRYDRAQASAPALADLNNDGRLDVVVGARAHNNPIFMQNANGTFSRDMGHQLSFYGVTVASTDPVNQFTRPYFVDINQDKLIDLVVSSEYGTQTIVNMGGNKFREVTSAEDPFWLYKAVHGNGPRTFAFGDIDRNGSLDVLIGGTDTKLAMWTQRADGVFAPADANPFVAMDFGGKIAPVLADLNSDGRLDLVAGGRDGKLRTYFQEADGRFIKARAEDDPLYGITTHLDFVGTPPEESNFNAFAFAAFGDIDGDGDLDLVLSDENRPLRVYTNKSEQGGTIKVTVDLQLTVTGITQDAYRSTFQAGEIVHLFLTLPEAVTVTGTPVLTLSSGGTAVYRSGSGTNILVFRHTVQPGQNTPDLTVTGLDLAGGTIGTDDGRKFAPVLVGNLDPEGTLVIDTLAPPMPTLTGEVATGLVRSQTPTLTGTTEPGSTVHIGLDDGQVGTVTADGDGRFSYTVANPLGFGTHRMFAYAVDAAGNTSRKALDTGFSVVDAAAPTTGPFGLTLTGGSDSGVSASDGLTNKRTLTVSGYGVSGTSVLLFADANGNGSLDRGERSLGITTVINGAFSTTLILPGDGEHRIVAAQPSLDGLGTGSDPLVVTLDRSAPTVAEVSVTGSGLTNGSGTLTVGQTATFTLGLSEAVNLPEAGSALFLTLSNGGRAHYDAAASDATHLAFTYTVLANHLADDLTVTGARNHGTALTDAAGNLFRFTGALADPDGALVIDGLTGTNANETFRGTLGADSFHGLGGNDTYYVDHAGDLVFEAADGGSDRVVTSVSHALAAGQWIEVLQTVDGRAIAAIDLTGNELAQRIVGNAGTNVLAGGGGADNLFGGAGADTFLFRAAAESAAWGRHVTIRDFSSAEGDRIDLSGIVTGASDGDFHFADGALRFSGQAGELIATPRGLGTIVQGDLDGDRIADLVISVVTGGTALHAGDFLLA